MLISLSKYVFKTHIYLRPFCNILKQQQNFEWTLEHKDYFDEIKLFLSEQISNTIPDPDQPIYAMGDP